MCWLNFHSLVPWGRKDLEGLTDWEMFFAIVACPNLPQPSLVLQSTRWATWVSHKWVTWKLTSDLSFPFLLLTLMKPVNANCLIHALQTGFHYWLKACMTFIVLWNTKESILNSFCSYNESQKCPRQPIFHVLSHFSKYILCSTEERKA